MTELHTDGDADIGRLRPDLSHLDWPFFEPRHRALAHEVRDWFGQTLTAFERHQGADGKMARQLHDGYAQAGFLDHVFVASAAPRVDLRAACLLREICGYSSVMADVALFEPWLGILPIALSGSAALCERQPRQNDDTSGSR